MAKKETKLCDAYSTRRTSLPAFGGVQSIVISADKDFAGCKRCALWRQTWRPRIGMSALPPKADIRRGWQCPIRANSGHQRQNLPDPIGRIVGRCTRPMGPCDPATQNGSVNRYTSHAACAAAGALINAKRSALIVSACVVGMPCGNPL
jgi:hypothetical protein